MGTLVKTKFCLTWGIAPHLGEIWGVEIFDLGVLWPRFSRNSLVRFRNFLPLDRCPPPLVTLEIWAKSDERNLRNVRPKLVPQPSTFVFRPTLRAQVQPRSDCHRPDCPRLDCPRSTPTTQSVAPEECMLKLTLAVFTVFSLYLGLHWHSRVAERSWHGGVKLQWRAWCSSISVRWWHWQCKVTSDWILSTEYL